MSVAEKFANEQSEWHNGRLHWNSPFGIPIRSNIPELQLKTEDYSFLTFVSDFKFYLFDLTKEEDRKYYQWVNDHLYNGLFSLITKEIFWDREKDRVKVYMEWTQNYLELPPNIIREAASNVYLGGIENALNSRASY